MISGTTQDEKALLLEIAQYGEMAYRRGFQQAVAMKANEEVALELRLSPTDAVYEVRDLPNNDFTFVREDLLKRLDCEHSGPIIQKLYRRVTSIERLIKNEATKKLGEEEVRE